MHLKSVHFTFCKNKNYLHKKHWDDITKRRKKRYEQVKRYTHSPWQGAEVCNDEKNQSRHTKSQISLMKVMFPRRLTEIKFSYFIWLQNIF